MYLETKVRAHKALGLKPFDKIFGMAFQNEELGDISQNVIDEKTKVVFTLKEAKLEAENKKSYSYPIEAEISLKRGAKRETEREIVSAWAIPN